MKDKNKPKSEILPLYPTGTNSTFFTECCNCAITDSERCCPSCGNEVVGYSEEGVQQTNRNRWKIAYRRKNER